MGKPSPPKPPNPKETSAAQTGTNVSSAIANNTMGLVDQYTPYGSLKNEIIGYETVNDPYTGKSYQVPRYKQTTALSAEQQAILDKNNVTQLNLADTGAQQSAFLKDYLATPANFDTSAIEERLTELGRARLDPMFAERRSALETQLANKGIAPGSEAYNRAMTLAGQQENDAYNQLYLTGRAQALGELQAERSRPINEITALLSGSQVTQPGVNAQTPQGMPTTDVAGLINANYAQRQQNYQTRMAQQQGLLGGLFGLGASAITGGLF